MGKKKGNSGAHGLAPPPELGLKTVAPKMLTAKEKAEQKRQGKKDRDIRTKQAMQDLADQRSQIEKHHQFKTHQKEEEMREKKLRKLELNREHLKAQNQRKEEADQRSRQLVEHQQVMTESKLEFDKEQSRLQKLERRKLKVLMAEKVKTAVSSVNVPVHRTAEIEAIRSKLPVVAEEQQIMEHITSATRSCTVICGETGSGKTTQVPQFLWEAGFGHAVGEAGARSGLIGVTEPRRVAATSMAQRVAEELNEKFGETVCYHVRYQNNLHPNCKLKFMTEGILLRELQEDFLLSKYSVVVIDEAHERSVSCDVLVGMLSRVVPLRQSMWEENRNGPVKPLKLVVMSATLRVTDFCENDRLFHPRPSLINVAARRFPVKVHFSQRTELAKYVNEGFKKVRQIHKKLPPGGILVFLSTQREIETLCQQLVEHYGRVRIRYESQRYRKHAVLRSRKATDADHGSESESNAGNADEEETDEFGLVEGDYDLSGDEGVDEEMRGGDADGMHDDFDYRNAGKKDVHRAKPTADCEESEGENWSEDENAMNQRSHPDDEPDGEYDSVHVLPLYSLLNFKDQQRVFEPPPPGKRLIVVATNVAETSITIPNIRYVVDAGRVKCKTVDECGTQCYRIEWASQAQCEQRAGRAGRTGPGHCYRLYSTAVFANRMEKHSPPEIMRTSLESVVLMMKCIGIDHVGSFPFPSPPDVTLIRSSLQHLRRLRLLDEKLKSNALGERVSLLPIAPRFGKILHVAARTINNPNSAVLKALVAAIAVVSTTFDVFALDTTSTELPCAALQHAGSDLLTYYNVSKVFNANPYIRFCRANGIVHKSMMEASQLSRQLLTMLFQSDDNAGKTTALEDFDNNETSITKSMSASGGAERGGDVPKLPKDQEMLFRKLIIHGLIDQVARRASAFECKAHGVKFYGEKTTKVAYFCFTHQNILYVHPSSSIAKTHPPPEYIVYAGLQRVNQPGKDPKTMMRGMTIVTNEWLHDSGFLFEDEGKEILADE